MNESIRATVERGLQFLFSLGLDATPSDFEHTVDGWTHSLLAQNIVSLNVPELQSAFNQLARSSQTFPTFNALLRAFSPQQWFIDAVATGLQQLLVLSLKRQPAAENITLVRDVWAGALWEKGELWEESRDADRIATAFKVLCVKCESWPQPAVLIANMPKRVPLPSLPPPTMDPEKIRQNRRRFSDILKNMKGSKMMKGGKP